jgi:prepilin-type N-terminal cleavage/methylation domain-containing protein
MTRRRALTGFTLVELLVALVIGGLALAAAVDAGASLTRRHREADRMARLQERAAHVFGVLEPEIQMAGFGGLQALSSLPWPALPAAAEACGTLHAAVALRIDRGSHALGCPAAGGGAVPDTDVLTVLRAGARLAAPVAGRVQVLTSRAAAGPRGLLLAGVLPEDLALREGLHELRDLEAARFYVARDSDGSPGLPALRIKELTAIAGQPAIRDTEVAPGVEALRIEEGWQAGVDGALRFAPPGIRPADRALVAVRVHLDLREGDTRAAVERTIAVRNVDSADTP